MHIVLKKAEWVKPQGQYFANNSCTFCILGTNCPTSRPEAMFILYTVVFQSVQMMTKLKSAGTNKVKNWIYETDLI